MADVKAFICGCAGPELTDAERRFLSIERPWGLILFRRNVVSPDQVMALTADFRACVARHDAPVLVDQEGGRVQRLNAPHWPVYPAAARYAALGEVATEAATLGGRLVGADLKAVGITIDCAPVLDVPAPGSHNVIGNRAFGDDPLLVARLGRAFADGLMSAGVAPVVKHIPGHGRGGVDSHLALPVVEASERDLERVDFAPFRTLADLPAAMTAHVVYTALDPAAPATLSRRIIERVIRGSIGFSGLLISDDLSMEALKGSLGERASAAAGAGCEMLLHCNGNHEEAAAVARASAVLDGRAAERAATVLAVTQATPDAGDLDALRARFAAMTAAPVA